MTAIPNSYLETAGLAVEPLKDTAKGLTFTDRGLGIPSLLGASDLLSSLKLEPVAAGIHQHASASLITEHEVPIVHSPREATRIICAGFKGSAVNTLSLSSASS